MFKDLRLKYRILFGYAIPLLLFVLASIFVFMKVKDADRAAEHVETINHTVSNIYEMNVAFNNMSKTARGYILAKNDVSLKNFEVAAKQLRESSQLLDKLVVDPRQLERLHVLQDLGNRLYEEDKKIMGLVDEGKTNEAIGLFKSGITLKQAREIDGKVAEFLTAEKQMMLKKHEELGDAMRQIISAILWGSLLSIVLAIAIGLVISSRISCPELEKRLQIGS